MYDRPARRAVDHERTLQNPGVMLAAASLAPAGVAASVPPAAEAARAEAAEARVALRPRVEAASRSDAEPALGWPAQGGLTGWYGERRRRSRHVGIDIDGETGDP